DKQNKLVGAVTAVDASKAIDRNLPFSEVVTKEVKTVSEDTLLTDLFEEVSVASIPVAVVDEQYHLRGIVIRGALIGALAGNDTYINQTEPEFLPLVEEKEVL